MRNPIVLTFHYAVAYIGLVFNIVIRWLRGCRVPWCCWWGAWGVRIIRRYGAKKSPISDRYSTRPIHFDGVLAVGFGLNDQTSLTPPSRIVASLILTYHMRARVYWGKGVSCAIVCLCQSLVFSGKNNSILLGLNPCVADLEVVSCHRSPVPQLAPENKLSWGSFYTLEGRVFVLERERRTLSVLRLPAGPVLSAIILFADFTASSAHPFDCR